MALSTNVRREHLARVRLQNARRPHISTGKKFGTAIRASTKRRSAC